MPLVGMLLLVVAAGGPEPGVPSARAVRMTQRPKLDGTPDQIWDDIPPLSIFTQQAPDEGARPSEPTTVRIAYDDRALYFLVRAEDHSVPAGIVANLTRRDRDTGSDAIIIDLDTRGSHTGAFHFEVSAAGVQRDALRTGDDSLNFDWDALWNATVRRDERGWTAWIEIPFSALRFPEAPVQDFRMQIRRYIARRNETDLWSFVPREEHGELLRYGKLEGIEGLKPSGGLLVVPYVTGRLRHTSAPDNLGLPVGWDFSAGAGFDLRYALTPGLTLDATVLPDFGQVDADQVILNLTTFELFYPEKRPFFLEGADSFFLLDAYGEPISTQPFYSRRIGAAVDSPVVVDGSRLTQLPEPAGVLGAAKLTGRAGPVELALLDGLTDSETIGIANPGGPSVPSRLVPLSNFAVGLARIPFAPGARIGFMATSVLRAEKPNSIDVQGFCPDGYPRGEDGRCFHDALTGALDLRWQSSAGTWSLTGTVLGSFLSHGPSRLLPDGTMLGPGSSGIGGIAEVAKAGGNLLLDAVFETYSPGLDLNDAGFLLSQNLHRLFTRVAWRTFHNGGPALSTEWGLELFGRQSWDGVRIARGVQVNNRTVWRNNWTTWLELQRYPTTYDNRELRDGGRMERPSQWGVEFSLTTNPSSTWIFGLNGLLRSSWKGILLDSSASITVRPASRLELALLPTWSRVTGDPRWVDTLGTTPGDRTYRIGLQDASAPGVTLKSTFTFHPKLTLQVYGQLFFASVLYRTLWEVPVSGATPVVHLSDLASPGHLNTSYDTADAVLNVNVVLRWEYLPGSALFVVYTRSQQGGLALDPVEGRPRVDWARLGQGLVADTFQVKLSYAWAR